MTKHSIFKLVLEKAEEPDHIANIHWIIRKARVPKKYVSVKC